MIATLAQIEAGLTAAPESLEQLEILLQFALTRDRKADEKILKAQREKAESSAGVIAAVNARDNFIKNDPERLL